MKNSKALLKALKTNLYISVLVMVVLSVLAINCIRKLTMVDETRRDLNFVYQSMREDLKNNVLEDKGKGCVMPQLDPFSEEVVLSEKKLPMGICEGKDWVECTFDKCSVAKTVQDDLKDVSCVYRDIVYVGNSTQMGPPRTLSDGQIYRLKKSDFVHVSCVGINRLHPGPQFQWSGYKAGLRRVPLRRRSLRGPRLNVVMLSFDAMSRNGFMRKTPKSHAALENMGAFILKGYNIVGDGTSGALHPILVGDETDSNQSTELFNSKDCILHQLFKMGYRTAYFGDSPVHGTFESTFNVSQSLPTDHHLLPLLYSVYGRSRADTRNFCFGDVPLYKLLLDLTHQFTKLSGPRFSFTFITDVSHEHFNMATAADTDLASFLQNFHKSRNMKNTMLFVMGAHGTSLSSLREVPQQILEDHLPLMAIVLPYRLKLTRPDAAVALAANVDVLTTPFDIHSTLMDILGIGDEKNPYIVPGADMERGLTLLRTIPVSRSCGEAGVMPHWCACATWEPLQPRDPLYNEIGNLLANYINDVTANFTEQCLPRQLTLIERVQKLFPNKKNGVAKHLVKIDNWIVPRSQYYKAKVVMGPGAAEFEATVRYYSKLDYFAIAEQDMSRLNSYANESACLTSELQAVRKFCYCRS